MVTDKAFHGFEVGIQDVEALLPVHQISKPRRKRRVNTGG